LNKTVSLLLLIAVMFTFSFGSAFAAVDVTPSVTKTHDEAMLEAKAEVLKDITTAATNAKAALGTVYDAGIYEGQFKCKIDGSVFAATIEKIAADATLAVEKAFAAVDTTYANETNVATLEGYIKNAVVDPGLVYDEIVKLDRATVQGLVDLMANVTADPANHWYEYYAVYTYTNALADMKAFLNGEIAKVDMSLYTDDVIDKTAAYPVTYAEKAAEIVAELQKAVADATVDMSKSFTEATNAIWTMYNKVNTGIKVKETAEYIDGTSVVVSYKLTNSVLKTAEELAAAGIVSDAAKASLKAQVQSTVASWTQWALGEYQTELSNATNAAERAAAKEKYENRLSLYADYAAVNNLLIDEEETLVTSEYTAAARVDAYEAAAKVAAVVKLEVEKDGSLKYDAAEVDEILADLQVEIYAGRVTTVTAADFAKALVAADTLEWDKAHAVCDVEDALEAVLYDATTGAALYYAPEQAKVEAKFQEKIDKINAAVNAKQLADAADDVVAYTSIQTKAQVNTAVASHLNSVKFAEAVNHYVGYLNYTADADGKRAEIDAVAPIDADAAKYLAELGARTNADVAAYIANAEEYAAGLQTVGEARAERVAVADMIKALPNAVTLADKDAVEAAYEAAKAAKYMTDASKLVNAITAVKTAEAKAIDEAIKALPAKLTAADDAAVEAIYDAIDAYEDEAMYGYPTYANTAKADKAAAAVKAAWLADVHAAIASASAAAPASVEAAREAVDAYVAKYNSVCKDIKAIEDIVNIDKLTYMEAEVAAAKIDAVEALKITAGSSAKKGSITVKWTVDGDTDAVEGYEIWRSTKKNSGFKKMFTTTKTSYKNTKNLKKGTRYYFKVRAIAYVGAEKIKSDWSNKAYRVAK